MSMGFVCAMGMATVFIGLICIILLCKIFSAIVRIGEKKAKPSEEKVVQAAPAPATVATANTEIPDKQRIIAAVCAAVAEELGTDVSALRVLSFKKI